MAYYLTIEKRKGQYTPLDITKTSYFTRLSNLKNMGCTLAEIDAFTMNFNDERELRGYLFQNDLIEIRNGNRPLSVRNLLNNKYNKVMYDMLYQKDLEYIMDPRKLIARINDKLYAGDYRFVKAFANYFMNYHDCSSTAPEVREFANTSIMENRCSRHFNCLDEQGDNPLVRMTKLLIYDYYEEPNGEVKYKSTIKYRNLHMVLAFINHYDKTYTDQLKQTSSIELPKTKTRKKTKNDKIPGQTNLFE